MGNAKKVWILSNGQSVSIGDNVQIDDGKEVYIVKITDIGEKFITGIISTGGELDAYFSELKDVMVV